MERPLHAEDIVAKTADLKALGVVERTTADIDTHVPYPGQNEDHIAHDKSIPQSAWRRFKKDGVPPKDTVLVRWRDDTTLELLPTSKVKLLDRSLMIGDVVKRSTTDAMSGIILQTSTKCTLQPMCNVTYQGNQTIKGLLPPGKFDPASQFCVYPDGKPDRLIDIPASELQDVDSPTEGDLVVYQDWIGRVEAITNNISIRLSDNCVVEIQDEIGEHADEALGSFVVGDVVKTKKGELRRGKWIFGQYNANTAPVGTVVSVRTIGADITWLQTRIGSTNDEPPNMLEAPELESADFQVYDKTRRPSQQDRVLPGQSISDSEVDVQLNLRVRFKDLTAACLKYNSATHRIPKLERIDNLGYDLNVFDVESFRTEVTIQWQDLTVTEEKSIDLVPDGSIDDEHAAWPGEIAHTLGMYPVPGMENVEQPEKVGVVQFVNAAERMANVKWSSGSYIQYSKDPDDENSPRPVIARSIRPPVGGQEEISLYDIEAPAAMNVRRGDIVLIAKPGLNDVARGPRDATWLGEIVDTPLDGSLIVRLGAASQVRDVQLFREEAVVAVRSDGSEDVDEQWNEGLDGEYDDEDMLEAEEVDEEDWTSEDESIMATYEDENGDPLDEDEVENEDWESAEEDEDGDLEMHDAPEHQTPPTSNSVTPTESKPQEGQDDPTSEAPLAYLVLDGDPPMDHAYRNEPSTTHSTHMKRTQKEHKILRNPSTLPQGVYIRTYETRLDLLRVLLVGPTETPYENAPFVIDFYLPPSFPAEPPQAYFHSWPAHAAIGAIGRANPNLYEDGKICLSLLGTWEGNKGEGWNASRSTLLQVIVSLLGLVLVREPYYNEAGYESLVGTEASKRPSALYSERIFLRAKGFLIMAVNPGTLAPGLQGLDDVIQWLYRDLKGPKLLDATISLVEQVLGKSDGTTETDGLTIMSKGACVSLRRVLDKLRGLKAQ